MRIKIICLLLCSLASVRAASSPYDRVWNLMTLYENPDNPALQSFALKGRIQGDAVSFHSEDDAYEDLAWRRLRFGVKAAFLRNFVIHSELDLDMNEADSGEWDEFYKRLTDAYLGWSASDALSMKLGKQSAPFTLDGATSSTKLLTPERSIVAVNMWFPTEYFTGIGGYGKKDRWSWRAAAYSASGEPEFGHFDSGYFGLLSAGRDIGENGSVRVDYVYNDPDYTGEYEPGTRDLQQVLALVYKQQRGKLGLHSEVAMARGLEDQGDLAGLQLMPFYDLTGQFQLVLQYAGVFSTEGRSDVRLGRYPSRVPGADRVEAAHNVLLGLNWLLYGHKLKWQNAVEYNHGSNLASTGEDYNGYGFTSALRISW